MPPAGTPLEHSHEADAIRNRIARPPPLSYLRDWIYGGIDGAVTTFAVVAGVVGAQLSPTIVLILGVANLLADGISMAASNYSGTKAERDRYNHLRAIERRHIADIPEGEREEIRQIFAAKGFSGNDLERAVSIMTGDTKRWIETMLVDEYGIAPVLKSPMKAALATFAAFALCGLVPLLSYLATNNFYFSVAATGSVFFAIGAFKSRWSLASWWASGLETLLIGMTAAGVAYAVGYGLSTILGIAG